MRKWTKEHARLIGKIIFADFLKKPLDKYRCTIEEVERSSIFERLPILIRRLSMAQASTREDAITSGVIAEIARNGKSFSIRYVYEGFNKIYLVDTSKTEMLVTERCFARSEIEEVNSYLHKLRRISSRNELTHRVIKGIVKHQGRYLTTGNPIDLVPLSQVRLVDWINRKQKNLTPGCPVVLPALYGDICNTWISRLVNPVRSKGSNGGNGVSVIVASGEAKPLRWFFQTQRDVNKRLIKQILDPVRNGISNGVDKENIALHKKIVGLTDNHIKFILKSEYGITLSRRTVGHCREEMGIPPAKRRLSGYKYPPLSANFSVLYPLTVESVRTNAPDKPGIYEFRLKAEEIDYTNCKTQVIYIGSTRNIKKRLREHLGRNSKNGNMKYFLKRQECFFRYILVKKDWKKEERKLYRLFMDTYGSAPKCNRVSP